MVTLILGINVVIEINVLLPSLNVSVSASINADGRCE